MFLLLTLTSACTPTFSTVLSRLVSSRLSLWWTIQELGELRNTLNTEVEQLRQEFQDLRTTLRQQLEATASLAAGADNARDE